MLRNLFLVTGNWVKESKLTKSGDLYICTNVIAIPDFSCKDEEGRVMSDFFDVVSFGNDAIHMYKNCGSKGDTVQIEGKIKKKRYEDKEGIVRYNTIIKPFNMQRIDIVKNEYSTKRGMDDEFNCLNDELLDELSSEEKTSKRRTDRNKNVAIDIDIDEQTSRSRTRNNKKADAPSSRVKRSSSNDTRQSSSRVKTKALEIDW